MDKLLYFKEWLTIKEASQYLSKAFNEKVKTKDIYRLALEDKLVLSLHFINATYVEKTKNISTLFDEKEGSEEPSLVFQSQHQLVKAGSCYDVLNTCHGQLTFKKKYYGNDFDLKLEVNSHKGIIFYDGKAGAGDCYYRLINYAESNCTLSQVSISESLSNDILLVVKTRYLKELVMCFEESNHIEKPLHCKERISLYKVIAILVEMNQLSQDKKFKMANIIKTYADRIGFDCPSSHTIAKYLKEASNYLPIH